MTAVPMILIPIMSRDTSIEENAEKRELTEFPKLSADNYTEFSTQFNSYIDDHLPFRDAMITGYSGALYYGFNTSTSRDVIVGKDGWLFYNKISDGDPVSCYKGTNLFTDKELKQIADNLVKSAAALEAEGREFVLFIVPNKERIYPEFMPDYFGAPADEYAVKQLIEYLEENTDINVVYAYDALMSHKNEGEIRELFYKGDTHWRHYGAYIGSKELLNAVGRDIPDSLSVKLEEFELTHDDNDLSMLLHLEQFQKEPIYIIPGTEHANTDPGGPEGRCYVMMDSLYNFMQGYVASQFEDHLCEITSYSIPDQSARIREYDPDVVVMELGERHIQLLLDWWYE